LIEQWLILIIVLKDEISKVVVEGDHILILDNKKVFMCIEHALDLGEVFELLFSLEELEETSELFFDVLLDGAVLFT
jgi:hypothetical protein